MLSTRCRLLGVREVDIWIAPVPDRAAALPAWERIVSPDERARADRFHAEHARNTFLMSRFLLRKTLSRYAAVAPEEWRFAVGEYGKPFISHPRGASELQFNLSHTDGLAALAVTRGMEIGIDVENVRRRVETHELAADVFSIAESRVFRDLPEAHRDAYFFSIWTLKESYIKARGIGLSCALDSIAFDVAADLPRISFDGRCADDPARWSFAGYRPSPDHVLAIAAPVPGLSAPPLRLVTASEFETNSPLY